MSAPALVCTPQLTNARVLHIALPIVLSNATVPLLGLVATGVVGQLGQAAPIAAVGLGSVILITLYWFFGFLRMGTSGLAAQALGAGDRPEMAAILLRGLMIAILAGAGLILAHVPLFAAALHLSPATPEVETLANRYLAIRVWGAPATIALYAVTGWLIAAERTRAVLALQVWMNGLNILLDLWFVLGLGFAVGGVATASLIAEWSGLAFGLWLCRGALAFGGKDRARIFDRARLMQMARINGDIMIRSALLQGAFTSFVFLAARHGTVALAANQVLLQFLELTAFALDGFAFAAESLVGQAVGAGRKADFDRAARLTGLWAAASALALGLLFWCAGPAIIAILTTDPAVRAAARGWLGWAALAPVLGVTCWMLDGIFIGATRTRDMRNAMIQSLVAYVPALMILPIYLGNDGLWLALMILFIARAATLGRLYPKISAGLSP